MNKSYSRIVETFEAIDAEGNRHVVACHQDFIEARSFEGVQTIAGMKSYSVAGGAVNFVDENTFLIVSSDQVVKRVVSI